MSDLPQSSRRFLEMVRERERMREQKQDTAENHTERQNQKSEAATLVRMYAWGYNEYGQTSLNPGMSKSLYYPASFSRQNQVAWLTSMPSAI